MEDKMEKKEDDENIIEEIRFYREKDVQELSKVYLSDVDLHQNTDLHFSDHTKVKKQTFYQFLNQQTREGTISRKACVLSVSLAASSLLLIIFGLVYLFISKNKMNSIAFWVLASVTGLPGFYVMYLLR